MPFGLCNAPATFERMMDNLLRHFKWTMCLCYLDDIIVFSETFEDHLIRLRLVLKCLQEAGLKSNSKKRLFAAQEVKILGHLVSSNGVRPDPDKIKAVRNFPTPKNIHDIRSFLGLCSYFRRFIKGFCYLAEPLQSLLKSGVEFHWGPEEVEAFNSLKKALTSDPVLGMYDERASTEIHTDASGYGIGAVLVQIQNNVEKVIAYASRTLTKAEKYYSTTERECLAIVWATNKFRPYIFGKHFTVVTDHHSLCWLMNLKDPSGRLARWALRLQEHDFDVKYKTGKKHSDADALSRNPVEEETETSDKFLAVTTNGKLWLPVIPKHLRADILRHFHDAPTAGHLGFAKTYDRIRKRFYWPGMYRNVVRYVMHCRECQRRKSVPQRPPGRLVPIPPAIAPFHRIGIDLLGRFPKSAHGNKWIIVCTDYSTRYAITKALPTAEVDEIAKFLLEEIVLRHGAPRVIITDRGAVFRSRLVSSLVDLCNIDHRFTTAYHPQTNGLTERFNKTLADMLSMYVDVEQKNWDEILPFVTFAYNTAKQETTGFTPFYLLHGREAETTLDTMLPFCPNDFDDNNITKIAARAEESRQLARVHTLRAQDKDRRRYDSKHQMVSYAPGYLVWVYTPVRKVDLSEKLLRRYFGPYQVLRRLSAVTYEVEDFDPASRKRKLREVVHVLRMKPYHDPAEQIETEDIPPKESYKGPITRSRIKTLEQNDSGALSSCRLEGGQTQAEVAQAIGVSQSVISRIWNRFLETGSAGRRPGQSRRRATTPSEDRYLVLTARRHRNMNATLLQQGLRSATGTTVSTQTVRNRLHGVGLYARQPMVCVRLTSRHRRDRREWATEHVNWRRNEWSNVLFSDESRFSVHPNNRRIFIWRECGNLYIIRDGPLTARRYSDEILRHIVVSYAAAIGDDFILMDDNCRPHHANLVEDFLFEEGIVRMEWPAAPDMNPIEHI
ncbi:transposon Tf2-9 polyprotein [Trichonephila clavipes]|nr:transposon Tf2-9 polyprotein [Trichonephila clavipes]